MIDGDLAKIIKDKIKSGDSFTEAEIVEYMIEISNGVEYCHRHKVVHKDLKPLNILSANGHLKLCDFGIAKFIENTTRINPDYCSEGYAAPEILGGKKFRFKVDIWSMGCILYELCTLKSPLIEGISLEKSTIQFHFYSILLNYESSFLNYLK